MKKLTKILLNLTAVCGLAWAGAQNRDSLDLEFAIGEVEASYAGFPDKVCDRTRADYETLKTRLRGDVRQKGRSGYDAVAEYMGWFEDIHLRCASFSDAYRVKSIPDYGEGFAPQQVACRVDDDTFLIRVPSFEMDDDRIAWVRDAAESYRRSGCERLIVDLRGNGGGNDRVYQPLLELLYDHEGETDGVEVRVSPGSCAAIRQIAAQQPGTTWLAALADSLSVARTEFIPLLADEDFAIRFDSVAPLPRRAGVIIDGCVASSGEQFVLDVRACSSRTTIYGRDNTLGCLDFSNLRRVDLPCCKISCMIPMTRSYRVAEGRGIDRDGIAPDVRIPLPLPDSLTDNVDEWVRWAAERLKTEKQE
ncbi:S41 family peptidase [Alistipes sp.]|uniref:S41 family peptidase n=1 Tax=Alistipes sp. TaxID=1872444 RepID=UPI003AEF3D9D